MTYRNLYKDTYYHVYNRGALSANIFKGRRDYERFIAKLHEYRMKCDVEVAVFCLMPNHFHLLLKEGESRLFPEKSNISLFMHRLSISYARYYNIKYEFRGVVFEGRFKSKMISNRKYYSKIKEYILDNPVRKGLVKNWKEWPYSEIGSRVRSDIE